MKVIGVDPAPGKESHVFDGESGMQKMEARQLCDFLDRERERGEVLVCWDAPLTGPWDPDDGDMFLPWDHTKRPIERFFTNKSLAGKLRVPKGISVLPYGGCPHWTITRRLLGLPRVGPYDMADLPLELATDEGHDLVAGGRFVVEVHPAVAIWLWCQKRMRNRRRWAYKKDFKLVTHLWRAITRALGEDGCVEESLFDRKAPQDDDELDVLVAWLLGSLWARGAVNGKGARMVRLLGDQHTGSMLLPDVDGLADSFEAYRREVGAEVAHSRLEVGQ